MNISYYNTIDHVRPSTRKLMQRMVHPCYGLVQEIGFLNCTYNTSDLLIAGGVLTGVHVLHNQENPGRTAYHIGGCGLFLEEPMIKTLGESVERYAQLLAEISKYCEIRFASYAEMVGQHLPIIPFKALMYFTADQFLDKNFPFQTVDQHSPLSWVKLKSSQDSNFLWIPAQLIYFGYQVKREKNEPWLNAGVSTGTATHITYLKAKKNALLELIQLDSAIGHWYSNYSAVRIELDTRTRFLERVLRKHAVPNAINYEFVLLRNPDLLSFSVAAVFYNKGSRLPKVAIGLGSDTCLDRAMYKAFLEGMGTLALTRLEIYRNNFSLDGHRHDAINPNHILNLDANAEYYGRGENFALIEQRFLNAEKIKASALPADTQGSIEEQVQQLVNSFTTSNKTLYECDINLTEVTELGFHVARVWSPDTLSLCLPSMPHKQHQRFKAYGGIVRDDPHPYP